MPNSVLTIKFGDSVRYDAKTGSFSLDLAAPYGGFDISVIPTPGAEIQGLKIKGEWSNGPKPVGAMPDVALKVGDPDLVVNAADFFSGTGIAYSLVDMPTGVTIDAKTGRLIIRALAAVADSRAGVRGTIEGGYYTHFFRLKIEAKVTTPAAVATNFDSAAAVAEVTAISPGAHTLDLTSNMMRLLGNSTLRLHTTWSKAGGDGLYRALLRVGGSNWPETSARRVSFNARARFKDPNWTGTRVDLLGDGRIQLLDYTGATAGDHVLATASAAWDLNQWIWLEVDLRGDQLRSRVYGEKATVPNWQITAKTTATGAGAFGPGGFPGGANYPIYLKRMEYTPA